MAPSWTDPPAGRARALCAQGAPLWGPWASVWRLLASTRSGARAPLPVGAPGAQMPARSLLELSPFLAGSQQALSRLLVPPGNQRLPHGILSPRNHHFHSGCFSFFLPFNVLSLPPTLRALPHQSLSCPFPLLPSSACPTDSQLCASVFWAWGRGILR